MATKKLYIPTILINDVPWYQKKDGSITNDMFDDAVQRYARKDNALEHAEDLAKSKRKMLNAPKAFVTPVEVDLVDIVVKTHNDANGGHPHVILEDYIDNKHVSVGLTTKPSKGKTTKNYPLEIDPLNSGSRSYMRRQATIDSKSKYKNKQNGRMTDRDYKKAKQYGETAKLKEKRKSSDRTNTTNDV